MDKGFLRSCLRSDRPPIDGADFQRTYDRSRVAVNTAIILATLAVSPRFDNRRIVVPILIALAATVLGHAQLRKRSGILEKVSFDTAVYVAMTIVVDIPEVTMYVVMTQSFLVFFHVRALTALRLIAVYLLAGLGATFIAINVDAQVRTDAETFLMVMAVTVMASIPTAWILSQVGAELLWQKDKEVTLAQDKDRLLADKDRFVASVSHELRTPLTAVVGLAHTLADDNANLTEEEKQEFITMIVQQGDEVAALVDDLLVAARAGSGHLALVVGEVDLVAELAAVMPDGMEMVSSTEQMTVVGDPVRVRQVLRNLVSNSARYGGENKRARIWLRGVMGVVAVEDDGPAIPDDSIDSIFTAYGRAHDRPGRTDSVGLGLTVSRQLARMMGGDVSYDHDGRWTSFQLSLPMSVMATSRAICAAPEEAMAAHSVKPR